MRCPLLLYCYMFYRKLLNQKLNLIEEQTGLSPASISGSNNWSSYPRSTSQLLRQGITEANQYKSVNLPSNGWQCQPITLIIIPKRSSNNHTMLLYTFYSTVIYIQTKLLKFYYLHDVFRLKSNYQNLHHSEEGYKICHTNFTST